jgi:hypothetical protein
MMARRFQYERRPSYSALKESMNGRQYSGLFHRQFVTAVTVQRITEKKTSFVSQFRKRRILMFQRSFHSCNLDPRSSEFFLDVRVVYTRTRRFNSA